MIPTPARTVIIPLFLPAYRGGTGCCGEQPARPRAKAHLPSNRGTAYRRRARRAVGCSTTGEEDPVVPGEETPAACNRRARARARGPMTNPLSIRSRLRRRTCLRDKPASSAPLVRPTSCTGVVGRSNPAYSNPPLFNSERYLRICLVCFAPLYFSPNVSASLSRISMSVNLRRRRSFAHSLTYVRPRRASRASRERPSTCVRLRSGRAAFFVVLRFVLRVAAAFFAAALRFAFAAFALRVSAAFFAAALRFFCSAVSAFFTTFFVAFFTAFFAVFGRLVLALVLALLRLPAVPLVAARLPVVRLTVGIAPPLSVE